MLKPVLTGVLGSAMAALLVAAPLIYFRADYNHAKRLRVVTPGTIYRSGHLSAAGLEEAIERFHIRTVINFQNETPDPDLDGVRESALCAELGIKYVFLPPDLISRKSVPAARPEAIDRFLAIMDDPDNHPVLIHCRAGLHRTGILAAVFRMEYEGWTLNQAIHELRQNGFGDGQSSRRNDYIMQYLIAYTPRPGSSPMTLEPPGS